MTTIRIGARALPDSAGRRDPSHEIKAVSDDGDDRGYASVFGVIDNYDDVIAARAFGQTSAGTRPSGHAGDALAAIPTRRSASGPRWLGTPAACASRACGPRHKRSKAAKRCSRWAPSMGCRLASCRKNGSTTRKDERRTLTGWIYRKCRSCTFPANANGARYHVKAVAT